MSLDCATCLQPPEACHLCPRAWAPLCPVCEQPGHAASECPWVLEAGEVPGVTGGRWGWTGVNPWSVSCLSLAQTP